MGIRKEIKEKHKEIPALDRYELLSRMRQAGSHRNKALIALLYITGARVEEVVKYNVKGELKGRPILKKQIEIQEEQMVVRGVRCLKTKNDLKRRSIPVVFKQVEQPFINVFLGYIKDIDDDSPLFNITRQRAYQILSRVGLFCHWLRHSRITHLVVDYGFSESQLVKFTGWSDGRVAVQYTHLNVTDLIDQMKK